MHPEKRRKRNAVKHCKLERESKKVERLERDLDRDNGETNPSANLIVGLDELGETVEGTSWILWKVLKESFQKKIKLKKGRFNKKKKKKKKRRENNKPVSSQGLERYRR